MQASKPPEATWAGWKSFSPASHLFTKSFSFKTQEEAQEFALEVLTCRHGPHINLCISESRCSKKVEVSIHAENVEDIHKLVRLVESSYENLNGNSHKTHRWP